MSDGTFKLTLSVTIEHSARLNKIIVDMGLLYNMQQPGITFTTYNVQGTLIQLCRLCRDSGEKGLHIAIDTFKE